MLQVSGNTGAPTLRLGAGVALVGDNQRVGGLRSLNSLGGTRKPIKPLTASRLRASSSVVPSANWNLNTSVPIFAEPRKRGVNVGNMLDSPH